MGALDGLRDVDRTRILAGPFWARLHHPPPELGEHNRENFGATTLEESEHGKNGRRR